MIEVCQKCGVEFYYDLPKYIVYRDGDKIPPRLCRDCRAKNEKITAKKEEK